MGSKNVLLLDSEGLYSVDSFNGRDEGYFVTLMILSSFISSILIYNQSIPTSLNMSHLKEIEKFAAGLQKMEKNLTKMVAKNSPTFIILARNWNNEDDTIENNKDYFDDVLSDINELKQLIGGNSFGNSFHFISLPDPATSGIKNHWDISSHDLEELKPAFVEKFKEFLSFLEEKISNLEIRLGDYNAKSKADKLSSGSTFVEMLEKLIAAFNMSNIDLNEILDTVRDGNRMQVAKNFVESFQKRVVELTPKLPCSETEIMQEWEKLLTKYSTNAIKSFAALQKPTRGKTADVSTDEDIKKFLLAVVEPLFAELKEENIKRSWGRWDREKEKVLNFYWSEICTGKDLPTVLAVPVKQVIPDFEKLPILSELQGNFISSF